MTKTKEKILLTALRLFARDGYAAVSVNAIAGELGITKGALYRHYKNKQDIFDSIVARMFEIDRERAKGLGVPEETYDKTPLAFQNISMEKIKFFIESQFRFWTEDEFARDFRRMLTLEQYRDPQMADLYQKIFVGGPISYMEDIFREMIERGTLARRNQALLAIEFYAPFYLLLRVSDAPPLQEEAADLLMQCVGRFIKRNVIEQI